MTEFQYCCLLCYDTLQFYKVLLLEPTTNSWEKAEMPKDFLVDDLFFLMVFSNTDIRTIDGAK